jgi:hypothetical protein
MHSQEEPNELQQEGVNEAGMATRVSQLQRADRFEL